MTRSFLILASAISSLISATTVAIFGIHTNRALVTNPSASFSLNQIPQLGGTLNPDRTTDDSYVVAGVSFLHSFLYQDAYIRSLQLIGSDFAIGNGHSDLRTITIGNNLSRIEHVRYWIKHDILHSILWSFWV
jgi:hypothetical protein